jgi:hypothetical protein
MKFEKIETIRVTYDDAIYCDITPSEDNPGCYDFWLRRRGYDISAYMFSLAGDSAEQLVELAEVNIPDYIDDLMELCDED